MILCVKMKSYTFVWSMHFGKDTPITRRSIMFSCHCQVFLLDSQVTGLPVRKETIREDNNSDDDDQRTYMFVLSTIENKDKPEHANRYKND